MGKLKALNFVTKLALKTKEVFVNDIKLRLARLFQKLEKIDIKLVEALHGQITKKRSESIYFKSLG